jgi:hypothetical protein
MKVGAQGNLSVKTNRMSALKVAARSIFIGQNLKKFNKS